MQLVHPPHDEGRCEASEATPRKDVVRARLASEGRQVGRQHRPGLVIEPAPAELQDLRLPRQRKVVGAVDHRFALSMPALVSAPDKKSFSSANSPILACSVFKSPATAASGIATPPLKTP